VRLRAAIASSHGMKIYSLLTFCRLHPALSEVKPFAAQRLPKRLPFVRPGVARQPGKLGQSYKGTMHLHLGAKAVADPASLKILPGDAARCDVASILEVAVIASMAVLGEAAGHHPPFGGSTHIPGLPKDAQGPNRPTQ
jgi:hypothetical protein